MLPVAVEFSFPVSGFGAGCKTAPVALTLTATSGAATVNLQQMPPGQQLSTVATLYVDNSQGPIPLLIEFPDTQMGISVPAFSQGFYPVMTGGLVFDVSAPLIGVLGGSVTPILQVLNFAVPPQPIMVAAPDLNAGDVLNVGSPFGWLVFNFTVPGSDIIYSSLQMDCSAYPAPVIISGVDINGDAWDVTQQAFTNSEFLIPPTAAGTAAEAKTTLADGGGTKALIPTRWRVALAGVAPTSTLPLQATSASAIFSALTTSGTTEFPVDFANQYGFHIVSASIFSAGVTEPWAISIIDTPSIGSPVTILEVAFDGSDVSLIGIPLGYTSLGRNSSLSVVAIATSAVAACIVTVAVYVAAVAASQEG